MKVVLLTGASSGIGYQTAEMLAKQGHKVYGAARRVEKIDPLRVVGVTPLKLDVTDEASLKQAVEEVIAKEGRIDVLINNAGLELLTDLDAAQNIISLMKREFVVLP
jgi:NADP-dependent 3-hydroxy acid dehydrogenase YdfG